MFDMKGLCMAAVALLLLMFTVDAHGHQHQHHRRLLSRNPRAADKGNGNGHGLKFDFSDFPGGAKGYINSLGTPKLRRIRRNSAFAGDNDELARMLEQDSDFGVDEISYALIHACGGIAAEEGQVAAPNEFLNGPAPTETDPAVDNVWILSSRPAAPHKIWLDFKGGSINNTAWNAGAYTVWPAYDTDSNPNAFSTQELQNIVMIWRSVSEDYAPFNVDITTIDQIAAGTPNSNYMRVAIGGSSSLIGRNAGGTAYTGVYGRSDLYYQPAFVFPNNLAGGNPKTVWEAISHEVGHTMGLNHDGITENNVTSSYYYGRNGWAPIMGVGYNQPLTQWSKGDYTGANVKQDDLAIIASKLGYIAAGNGNTTATATALVASPTATPGVGTATAVGIIAQTGAIDYFALTAGAPGTLSVSVAVLLAAPAGSRSNLDAAITVYNANMAVVGTFNDAAALSAAADFALPAAGTYYIAVTGVGMGDLNTGYSNYGSLGQFTLTATYPISTAAASPSPSPSSSPSPSPTPSPSPSPSPSPQPPKLLAATPTFTATAVRNNKGTVTGYDCRVQFYTTDAATGARLGGVRVTWQWITSLGTSATSSTLSSTTPSALGYFVTGNYRVSARTGSCKANFISITLEGYTIDLTTAAWTSLQFSW